MPKNGDKTYWFKAKKYGWGWGLPMTWQGWISFGVFFAVWMLALRELTFVPQDSEIIPTKNIVIAVSIMVVDVAALVYVSFKYGEAPKWRWGNKKNGKSKESRDLS